VILVYTGQPVENNTAYARYSKILFSNNNFLKIIKILASKNMLIFKVLSNILELIISYIITKYSRIY
jgi:hypothetical protein